METPKHDIDIDLLEESMDKFKNILSMRSALNLKVANRVTFLTRFTIITFGVMAISFLFVMFILATKIDGLTLAIQKMNSHFSQMTMDMVEMSQTINQMDMDVNSLPTMLFELNSMDNSMANMDSDISLMSQNMTSINNNMGQIKTTVNKMDHSFAQMEHTMSRMQYDVNNIAKPMRLFNDFTPFGR